MTTSAKEVMEHLERTKFSALKINPKARTTFGDVVSVIEPEIKDFVESLYQAFLDAPDYWYPVELGSDVDLVDAKRKMTAYGRARKPERVVISMRRDKDTEGKGWFRASGYTPRPRS